MIDFIIGGTYTLVLALLVFAFGYTIGQKSETNVLHEMRQSIARRKRDMTGPIKPTSKPERERQANKGLQDFVDDL